MEKQPQRCLLGTDLLTVEDRSVLNDHYSMELKKLSKLLGHDSARNSEAEANSSWELCVTLQNRKQQYKNVNRKRKSFLHDIALLSLEERERNILRNHYCQELQIIRQRLQKLIQQESAENTANEARQPQRASLPLIQGCTHGSFAAGLSDKKVRIV